MGAQDYTAAFVTPAAPEQVFESINDVRSWWSGDFTGSPDQLGAEFTYEVPGAHWCRMRVTEFVPGKRIAWQVTESVLHFTQAKADWDNTEIRFELTRENGGTKVHFAHVGLSPARECYEACSGGWRLLLGGNLPNLIKTGEKQPNVFAG